MTKTNLPSFLSEIADDFCALGKNDQLQLLLELADELPELPQRFQDHPDLLERVVECQSPVYIFVELHENKTVQVHATAPEEAPTTRGFASILSQGLSNLPAEQVLAVPDDYPNQLGLGNSISLLRLRGMSGMLSRIKRQVREKIHS